MRLCTGVSVKLNNVVILGSLPPPYSLTLSQKRHDFREMVIEPEMCVLIFSTIFVWNITILRRIQRNIVNVHLCACTMPVVLVRLYGHLYFLERYKINTKFHENPSSGSQVFPCGRIDMTKLAVSCRNFANASKNQPVNAVNREIIAVCSQIHTKHINTLRGQNVE
jgi:hypothetical protein